MLVTPKQVEILPNEELRPLLKMLLAEFELLRQRVADMEAENEYLKQQLTDSNNSRNSSQPPSRDQKTNQLGKQHHKHGPPLGHQRFSRLLVDKPDQMIQAPVTECENCLANLSDIAPIDFERRPVTVLPKANSLVLETRQHHTTCPDRLTLNRGFQLADLEAERNFGPNLEVTIIFYKQTQYLTYAWNVEIKRALQGVTLSKGTIAVILQRAGEIGAVGAAGIEEEVSTGDLMRSGETSARLQACTWRQRVLISEKGLYHTLVPTRITNEIRKIMVEVAIKAWTLGCFSVQLKTPAQVFQLCLDPQLPDLEKVLDAASQGLWAQASQKLQNRFSMHRAKLLTVLSDPLVPPTNNESEQVLRDSVINYKVTSSLHTEWEVQNLQGAANDAGDCQTKGEQALQTFANLMGTLFLFHH
jgi:hypothetical protein